MRSKYYGDMLAIRAVEDCIRNSRKYTKGAFRHKTEHPSQGQDIPSKFLVEYYEVYPEMEVSWDMPASLFITLLWGDTPRIDVFFYYDYREMRARVEVMGDEKSVKQLQDGIPGLTDLMVQLKGTPDYGESPSIESQAFNHIR